MAKKAILLSWTSERQKRLRGDHAEEIRSALPTLSAVVTTQIRAIKGAKVASSEEIKAVVGNQRYEDLLAKECDSRCADYLAQAMDSDFVVSGSVGKLEDEFVITLVLVDKTRGNRDRRIVEVFRGRPEQLIRAVRFATRKLLGMSTERKGGIQVTSEVPKAAIFINGEESGISPLRAEIASGKHSMRLSKSGYQEWQTDFYVDPGETTPVWADPRLLPESWYEKWWVWTLVGLAAAGGTTALVLTTTGGDDATDASINIAGGQ